MARRLVLPVFGLATAAVGARQAPSPTMSREEALYHAREILVAAEKLPLTPQDRQIFNDFIKTAQRDFTFGLLTLLPLGVYFIRHIRAAKGWVAGVAAITSGMVMNRRVVLDTDKAVFAAVNSPDSVIGRVLRYHFSVNYQQYPPLQQYVASHGGPDIADGALLYDQLKNTPLMRVRTRVSDKVAGRTSAASPIDAAAAAARPRGASSEDAELEQFLAEVREEDAGAAAGPVRAQRPRAAARSSPSAATAAASPLVVDELASNVSPTVADDVPTRVDSWSGEKQTPIDSVPVVPIFEQSANETHPSMARRSWDELRQAATSASSSGFVATPPSRRPRARAQPVSSSSEEMPSADTAFSEDALPPLEDDLILQADAAAARGQRSSGFSAQQQRSHTRPRAASRPTTSAAQQRDWSSLESEADELPPLEDELDPGR